MTTLLTQNRPIRLSGFGYGLTEIDLFYQDIGEKRDGYLMYLPGAERPLIVLSSRLASDDSARVDCITYLLARWQTLLASDSYYLCFERVIQAPTGRTRACEPDRSKLAVVASVS